jgi:hypothetical protein
MASSQASNGYATKYTTFFDPKAGFFILQERYQFLATVEIPTNLPPHRFAAATSNAFDSLPSWDPFTAIPCALVISPPNRLESAEI